MAFTEFCCRSGGSNLNAGTRTGSSTEPGTGADLTYASGNWVASTGVFTVASGDPVADGVAVGDFASVYADGATVTTLVGRVTARTTTTITVSTTAKSGTTSDGTGNRTLKIGGAWKGPNGSEKFPFGFVTNGLMNSSNNRPRINLKNDATYNITAEMEIPQNYSGPMRFQGYATSYGDGGKFTIDGGTTGASYRLLYVGNSGSIQFFDGIFQNNGATGIADGVAVSSFGGAVHIWFVRCVVNNVRGNGFLIASQLNGAIECEAYSCNQSADTGAGGFKFNSLSGQCDYCISHDNNGFGFGIGGAVMSFCIADTNTGAGFLTHKNAIRDSLINCSSYNNGGDGYSVTIAGAISVYIANCDFVKNGGYGINVPSGGTKTFLISNCAFGSGTQANVSGATNIASSDIITVEDSVTYPSDAIPYADAPNGDFSITLAEAKNAGRGAYTQTQSGYAGTAGYPDIGAAQSQSTGGGGGVRMVNIRGGADQ